MSGMTVEQFLERYVVIPLSNGSALADEVDLLEDPVLVDTIHVQTIDGDKFKITVSEGDIE